MKRALLILLLSATAHAQPAWNPQTGWNGVVDPTRAEFERKSAEHERRFLERAQQMEEASSRSRRQLLLPLGASLIATLVIAGIGTRRRRRGTDAAFEEAPTSGSFDVTVLRIAVEGGAAKFVATEIDRLSNLRGPQLIRELGLTLRRVRVAWIYGGAVNEPMRSLGEAKATFAKHVDDAKLRGETKTPGSIAIVTVVVCARGELMTVDHIDSESLRRALEAAAYRDESEIIDVAAIVTTVSMVSELEETYPRPHLVPLVSTGMDKNFCKYCGGPFPSELTVCPHCGAPAR